jgi:biopolymer transport protein ExbD
MRFKIASKKSVGMDITPLVDTVFNLLIFFALSLNFVTSPGIQVKLPKSSAEQFPTERTEIIVAITRDGIVFADQKRIRLDKLYDKLNSLPQKSKEQGLVIIQADEKTVHGRVVEVMDAVKRAGWARLAIATSPEERVRRE